MNLLYLTLIWTRFNMKTIITGLLLILPFTTLIASVDVKKVSKKKQTAQGLYMTAEEAYEDKSANPSNSLFVDIRTRAELQFVGAPGLIDLNIPYMLHDKESWNVKKKKFSMEPNSNFSIAIDEAIKEKGLNKNSKIILICRSGNRSAGAVNLLDQLGYKNVVTVTDGFEGGKAKTGPNKGHRVVSGWKNAGLPWSYKLDENKMYFED